MASEHKSELNEEQSYLLLMAKKEAGLLSQSIDLVDLVLNDGSIARNQIILDSRFILKLEENEDILPDDIKEIRLRR